MKLLHTADWHLGKTLKGQNLLDDQIFILNQLFDVIRDQNPDVIIISGDIYDRGIPPAEAVELFDDILNRFAEKKLPTLIISGNHDSATRLNFGSKLFRSKNIFIASKIEDKPAQVVLEDNFGEIYFSLIPFFDPAEIKAKFFDENAERLTFNDANKFYVDLARENIPENKRSVAIAHVFISGEKKTDSVRDIVGGAEGIDAKIFSDYNYTALGHLHSPRFAGKNIFYSGSPLKYSFDEANHRKSVAIVEINGYGEAKIEK
ncbi:MAG: exonuclease subunit SbcD, partial [Opitutales bacterium]|nr:exonuclease subunit SbcD [Opitutales bacterium]